MIVAQQGIAGSYHDFVRLEYFPGSEMMGLDYFHDVVVAVEEGRADVGIMALENSIQGDTPAALELRTNFNNLTIIGEAVLDITHRLLGVKGAMINEIRSHPVALNQCRKTSRRKYPGVSLVESTDTAEAAKEVAILASQGITDVAAIASRSAGKLYGLDELDTNMNDEDTNQTRFLIFRRQDSPDINITDIEEQDKTTARILLPNNHDSLISTLKVLQHYEIDFTSLAANAFRNDSRKGPIVVPTEFTHGWHDDRMRMLERELQGIGAKITILGSYASGKVFKV